jgi:hypothetical protein
LEAINGSKNDTREKTFSLIPSTGQLMFWTSYSSLGNITVNIDGNYAGTISGWYSSSPSCGATYGVTKDLSPGSHSFSATNGSKTWSGNYTVASGSCLKVQLIP